MEAESIAVLELDAVVVSHTSGLAVASQMNLYRYDPLMTRRAASLRELWCCSEGSVAAIPGACSVGRYNPEMVRGAGT